MCKTWKIDDSFYSTDTGDKNKKRSIDNNIPNENWQWWITYNKTEVLMTNSTDNDNSNEIGKCKQNQLLR